MRVKLQFLRSQMKIAKKNEEGEEIRSEEITVKELLELLVP